MSRPVDVLRLAVAAFSVMWSGACGGGSSVTPTTLPTPRPNAIEMGAGMPASGATLTLGSCGFGKCTDALAYAFTVTFDAGLRSPVLRVRLTRDDGEECLSSYRTHLWPLVAGEPHAFEGETLLLSTTPPASPTTGDQNCVPPFTTTRMTVELRDTDIAAPVLLARGFDTTYHWVQ